MSTAEAPMSAPAAVPSGEPLLRIQNVKKYFPIKPGVVFQHEGMGEAMKGLFEDHWRRSRAL